MSYEQRRNFKEYGNKKDSQTVKISGTHIKDSRHGKLETHIGSLCRGPAG